MTVVRRPSEVDRLCTPTIGGCSHIHTDRHRFIDDLIGSMEIDRHGSSIVVVDATYEPQARGKQRPIA